MREPLRVVSLDAAGRVRRVAVLLPGRLFCDFGARWIVELPVSGPAPRIGMALQFRRPAHTAAFNLFPRPILAPWPER